MPFRPLTATYFCTVFSGIIGLWVVTYAISKYSADTTPHLVAVEKQESSVLAPCLPDTRRVPGVVTFKPNERNTETVILRHGAGFTLFDQLYTLNGTFYIVSSNRDEIPPLREIISSGLDMEHPVEEWLPTSKHIQIITPQRAGEIFGPSVTRIKDVSFILNDPCQFMNHYYHFVAEMFLGMWRTYTSLDTGINKFGETSLPPPSRLMITNCPGDRWMDGPGLNEYVIRSAFPLIGMETTTVWDFKTKTGRPFMFERVVLGDRGASTQLPPGEPHRTVTASTFRMPGSPNWWLPIRTSLMESIGFNPKTGMDITATPVITYISRQGGYRRLIEEDHEGLVRALEGLQRTKGYEVNIVQMEQMTIDAQLRLAARSTIMMGVHGNGLTAVLWMYPTIRSALFEFMIPGGYTNDYALTARRVGIPHYGFWGTSYFNISSAPKDVASPEGFHGNSIPINGDLVASVTDAILSGKSP